MFLLKKHALIGIACILFIQTSQLQAFRFVVYSDCRAPKADWDTKPFPANLFNIPVLGFINGYIAGLYPKPSFAIFMGDLINRAFPKADPSVTSNLEYWKTWMTQSLGDIKLYVGIGNSDLYGTTWWTELPLQEEFAQTFSDMPDNGPQTPVDFRHLTYSFEHGEGTEKSLFVVLDSFGIYGTEPGAIHCDNDFDPVGYDDEQINWFAQQTQSSSAKHKFVLAHGPAFSALGYPVGANVRRIWNIAVAHHFDTFFCAHEHIYLRSNISNTTTTAIDNVLVQQLTGDAGALPDNPARYNNPNPRIYFGYNFVVVDVDGNNITQHAYKVVPNGNSFSVELLDTLVIAK
ncbi:MAG: hypothetical protein UU47_C0003G0019 [candidate division TM6 bacterium GW2011_GWE2_41_16]|nr:MAG: hypothetical protein UU47_C0003G0019 [candidate division TM6 bacterium GW2011_GWE2_41_16]